MDNRWHTHASNISAELYRRACRSTAKYISKNAELFRRTRVFSTREELLNWAVDQAKVPETGATLEFGVGAGTSLKLLAELRGAVTGFDTFDGLPEDWRVGFPEGSFKEETHAALSELLANPRMTLIKGLFSDTLPVWCEANEPVSFLHIDSDLYSSAVCVLQHLESHLIDGAIVVFDEYWNYPGWESGEFKALAEWRTKFSWDYLAYNEFGEQVAIRLRESR